LNISNRTCPSGSIHTFALWWTVKLSDLSTALKRWENCSTECVPSSFALVTCETFEIDV
jgi:hypothetical protein